MQRVLKRLEQLDVLWEKGKLDVLLASLSHFSVSDRHAWAIKERAMEAGTALRWLSGQQEQIEECLFARRRTLFSSLHTTHFLVAIHASMMTGRFARLITRFMSSTDSSYGHSLFLHDSLRDCCAILEDAIQ